MQVAEVEQRLEALEKRMAAPTYEKTPEQVRISLFSAALQAVAGMNGSHGRCAGPHAEACACTAGPFESRPVPYCTACAQVRADDADRRNKMLAEKAAALAAMEEMKKLLASSSA